MSNTFSPVAAPLRQDATGTIRVDPTRMPIDTLVLLFNAGVSAEEMVLQFPGLALATVYAALAYYLDHRQEMDAYMAKRQAQADELRRELEAADPGRATLRQRLMERAAAKGRQK